MSHTYRYKLSRSPNESVTVIVNGDWSGMAEVLHIVAPHYGGKEHVNQTYTIPGEFLRAIFEGEMAGVREEIALLAESVGLKVMKE